MRGRISLAMIALVLATVCASAGEYGTMDEAKTLAIRAAEFLKANGVDKARDTFAKKDGGFQDRDLYPFMQDRNGILLGHATMPALVGRNMSDMKDVDGKAFPREISALKEPGWVDFRWQHPQTKAVVAKTDYCIPVQTDKGDVIVGVGAYKQ